MRLFANHPNEFGQFKKGNKHALKFFFSQFGRAVCRYLFFKCGDMHTAKVLTAQVFRKLWRFRNDIGNEDHLIGFLFITAYHLCLSKQQGDKTGWKADVAAAISAEEAYLFLDDPDVLRAGILSATNLAMGKLTLRQRIVMEKLHIERKSVQKTATEMGLHPGTIRRYNAEAFYFLRHQLPDLEFLLVTMGLFLSREPQ